MASLKELQQHVVSRFGVTPKSAEALILEMAAKASIKKSVAAASSGVLVTANDDSDFSDPQAWRAEVQKRMQGIEIMEEGVEHLKKLQKLAKRVYEAEQKLIAKKIGQVNKRDEDWWDFRNSGWAMGGREMFAQNVCDILSGLDEGKLASKVMEHIGFKRSIPIPDENDVPLIPEGIKPGDTVPAYEEDPVEEEAPPPQDGEGVEAMLVRGAKRTQAASGSLVKAKLLRPHREALINLYTQEKMGGNPWTLGVSQQTWESLVEMGYVSGNGQDIQLTDEGRKVAKDLRL